MRYQVTVKIRSENEKHPPYVYERTTDVRISEFSREKVRSLIDEAREDYVTTYPHLQGRDNANVIPPIKVTVLEVD